MTPPPHPFTHVNLLFYLNSSPPCLVPMNQSPLAMEAGHPQICYKRGEDPFQKPPPPQFEISLCQTRLNRLRQQLPGGKRRRAPALPALLCLALQWPVCMRPCCMLSQQSSLSLFLHFVPPALQRERLHFGSLLLCRNLILSYLCHVPPLLSDLVAWRFYFCALKLRSLAAIQRPR